MRTDEPSDIRIPAKTITDLYNLDSNKVDDTIDGCGSITGLLVAAFATFSAGAIPFLLVLIPIGFAVLAAGMNGSLHNLHIFDSLRSRAMGLNVRTLRHLRKAVEEHNSEASRIAELADAAGRMDSLGEETEKQLNELLSLRVETLRARKLSLEKRATAFIETARANQLLLALEANPTLRELTSTADTADDLNPELELEDHPDIRREIIETRARVELARLEKTAI